ncbi:hypothetical protein J6590_041196 [Homalodisca vitripennis]|nr:hypothetical protein J6590_041196 [Homalodisca vitripennis]
MRTGWFILIAFCKASHRRKIVCQEQKWNRNIQVSKPNDKLLTAVESPAGLCKRLYVSKSVQRHTAVVTCSPSTQKRFHPHH